MARLGNSGIRTAKKTLARWFCGSATRLFLPLSGPGLPVSRAEELAILAAAEPYIVRRFNRLNGQLSLGVLLMVAVPTFYAYWLSRVPAGISLSAGTVAIASGSVGGVLLLVAAWRYERSVLDLRDAVALSLRERRSGAAAVVLPIGRRDPDIRKLGLLAFILTGLFLLWPLAGILWQQYGPAKVAAWGLEAAAGAVGGVVIGILLFVALWALRLRRIAASSEDGSG